MSTLKANAINNISASVGGITIDSSGTVSGSLPSPNRNLLYNGAMQIHQRNSSVTGITTNGYYTADRFFFNVGTMGTWTNDIQNDAPIGSGFQKSFRLLCTTADASPAASDLILVQQLLEGQDLQRIRKGTSSAQKLSLSFWVKTNVSGTFVASLVDSGNSRTVSSAYSISSGEINTWVKRVIAFPSDTVGTLANTNAGALNCNFWLGGGSNFTSGTLNTTWATYANANAYAGGTNLASATNNYWQITGVQLETGDPTDFEFKSYGQELRECQRYYERGFFWYEGPANGGSHNVRNIQYAVQKRTGVFPTAGNFGNVSGSNANISSHAPEDGYDVYNPLYPQSNSNTGFNWRFVATSTGNCTIRQWWAVSAEL